MESTSPSIVPLATFPRWTRFFAHLTRAAKGWPFLLLPFFIFAAVMATAMPLAFAYDGCDALRDEDDEAACMEGKSAQMMFQEVGALASYLLMFLMTGAAFAWTGDRRRRRLLRRAYERRAQGVRDRVVAGGSSPETFDALQQLWKPLVRGTHPALMARAGSAAALAFAILCTIAFVIGLGIFTTGALVVAAESTLDSSERMFLAVWYATFLPILIGLFIAATAMWTQIPRVRSRAVRDLEDTIDAAEREELRLLAGWSNGGRRVRQAIVGDGPSYSPYTGRAKPD